MRLEAAIAVAGVIAACTTSGEDSPCVEPQVSRRFPSALAEQLATATTAHFPEADAPGVAVAVLSGRHGWWYDAVGLGDTKSDAPMTIHSIFRIGSITKTFIAALVLRWVEAGVWDLDDAAATWLEGYPVDPAITLRQLLNHTSGVFNFSDDPAVLGRCFADAEVDDMINVGLTNPPVAAPGESFHYSNTNYYLLGRALEQSSGRPLEVLLREELFEPLQLSSMVLEQFEPEVCPLGQGHLAGATINGFNMACGWAAGGLVANVTDLCRWLRHLSEGRVVSPTSLAAMTSPTPNSDANGWPYGLGMILSRRSGLDLWGHSGSTTGFNGEAFWHAPSGTCVAVQANDFAGIHEAIAEPLWSVVASELASRMDPPR